MENEGLSLPAGPVVVFLAGMYVGLTVGERMVRVAQYLIETRAVELGSVFIDRLLGDLRARGESVMIKDNIQRLRLIVKSVANQKLDAIDLLQIDHIKLRTLFLQMRALKNTKRQEQVWKRIEREYLAHTLAEESVFYPACAEFDKLKEIILEFEEEHRLAKSLMRSIDSLRHESERWLPKIHLLMENIEHHIEREEAIIFPLVRRFLDYKELQDLGDRILTAKRQERTAA